MDNIATILHQQRVTLIDNNKGSEGTNMALIYCKECGREVSDKAANCPHCGAPVAESNQNTKFCKHCGERIDKDCLICPKCGKQVEELRQPSADDKIVINNSATANATIINGRQKNKWVALVLCLLFGYLGVHRFYEGKIGTGILYLLTLGLFGIGWLVDFIILIFKPNPYYV